MTGDVAAAEDLLQDASIQVFRKISTFRGDAAFSTWLHRVAVNTVLMSRRKRTPPQMSLDDPVRVGSSFLQRDVAWTDPGLSGAPERIDLIQGIRQLPQGCPFCSPKGGKLFCKGDRLIHRQAEEQTVSTFQFAFRRAAIDFGFALKCVWFQAISESTGAKLIGESNEYHSVDSFAVVHTRGGGHVSGVVCTSQHSDHDRPTCAAGV
jgi:Sigma-70 region 2